MILPLILAWLLVMTLGLAAIAVCRHLGYKGAWLYQAGVLIVYTGVTIGFALWWK